MKAELRYLLLTIVIPCKRLLNYHRKNILFIINIHSEGNVGGVGHPEPQMARRGEGSPPAPEGVM